MTEHDAEILGVKISRVSGKELLSAVESAVRHNERKVFAYLTVHGINLAQRLEWFREFLNKADIVYADGAGVLLASILLGGSRIERIPLTRWIWELAGFCEKEALSVYMLGSTESSVTRAASKLCGRFPGLRVVGCHHGYFEKFDEESERVISEINACSPHILFVGFGMPAQEEWIQRNRERLNVYAIFTAGSCFDFVSGAKRVCPLWFSRIGFEWLFRLFQEPRRLFIRYVVGNPTFMVRVLMQRLRHGRIHKRLDVQVTTK